MIMYSSIYPKENYCIFDVLMSKSIKKLIMSIYDIAIPIQS